MSHTLSWLPASRLKLRKMRLIQPPSGLVMLYTQFWLFSYSSGLLGLVKDVMPSVIVRSQPVKSLGEKNGLGLEVGRTCIMWDAHTGCTCISHVYHTNMMWEVHAYHMHILCKAHVYHHMINVIKGFSRCTIPQLQCQQQLFVHIN